MEDDVIRNLGIQIANLSIQVAQLQAKLASTEQDGE